MLQEPNRLMILDLIQLHFVPERKRCMFILVSTQKLLFIVLLQ